MRQRLAALLRLASLAAGFDLVINPKKAQDSSGGDTMVVDISKLRNNRGFAMSPGDADFDGNNFAYPAQFLPDEHLVYDGINYNFPQYQPGNGSDNVLAQGQMLDVPKGRYIGVHMLAAAESAIATGFVNATYGDGSTSSGQVLVDPFWDWPYPYGGDIIFPYLMTDTAINYNRTMIFQTVNWLDSTKELTSLRLPNVTVGAGNGPGGTSEQTRLHIFAVSMIPAMGRGLALDVQYARSTNIWFEGTNKTQIVEATINNVGTEWILAKNGVKVMVDSVGLQTVQPGVIHRLRPGDQAIVQVGVVNRNGVAEGTEGVATLVIEGEGVHVKQNFNATFGISTYEPTYASIYKHESPQWYNGGKFGIFIHWGVYSVPGWGNKGSNETYAEWYWWDMNIGPATPEETYQYNLEIYGPDHNYDDFIPEFTASAWNPREWVDLFADAGAQYFVQVSKHHDGYAIFDLPKNVTRRTSVELSPHRNLLGELFDAAIEHQPHLHRATYFSLPEWFSPAYAPFGFSSWPGGNATNPYTNETLPYTGFVPVDNFVEDVILPEMKTLAAMGSEILWCDIGGPNLTAEFSAEYFNINAAQGRQVMINNRCGTPGDFDTPEYARYGAVQARKWESNLGMDPFSYGYNRATPDDAYIKPDVIVTSLIDIVSKNGNFLLDIGPTANGESISQDLMGWLLTTPGTIIAVEQDNLRAAGKWIKTHAEAIFNTTYWYITPEEGEAVRFTQTPDAFYISTLYAPNATLTLRSPVPYVSGDKVTIVGGKMAGHVVPSKQLGDGSLQLSISEEVKNSDEYAWVFKIDFGGGVSGSNVPSSMDV